MAYVLLIQKMNWADEIDIEAFALMTKEEWEKEQENLKNLEYPYWVGVGSNQDITFDSPEDWLNTIVVEKEITDEEAAVLKRMFFKYDFQKTFGKFKFLEE